MTRAADLRLLGFVPDPAPDEIEAAYRRLALEHHPDRGGDPARFAEVTAARDRLLEAAGDVRGRRGERCPACGGSGKQNEARGFYAAQVACRGCGGTGRTR